MNKKNFWAICLLLLSITLTNTAYPKPYENIYHLVFVWLKDQGNEEQKAKLINMVNTFKKIPSVLDISAGEMIKSKRAIVDSSYDVGFVMQYKSIEAMESYLQHPLHKKAVEEVLSPLAKKVLVYDIGIQGD
ncbi:MAG: Dabb family protein [Pseudomonadota bacterium]